MVAAVVTVLVLAVRRDPLYPVLLIVSLFATDTNGCKIVGIVVRSRDTN